MGSAAARDLGLARIGKATRYMAAGVLLGGAALSAAAAKALPGHNGHPTSVQTGSGATNPTGSTANSGSVPGSGVTGGSSGVTSGSDQTGGALTPPTQAPQPTYTPPVVNSGGS